MNQLSEIIPFILKQFSYMDYLLWSDDRIYNADNVIVLLIWIFFEACLMVFDEKRLIFDINRITVFFTPWSMWDDENEISL